MFEFVEKFVDQQFEESIIPKLQEYIYIPNLSPMFDKEWETNGLLDKAVDLLYQWAVDQKLKGCKIEKLKEKGRTPLIFVEVEPTLKDSPTVLLYGHVRIDVFNNKV